MKHRYHWVFLLLIVAATGLYGQQKGNLTQGNHLNIQDIQPMDTIRDIAFATRVDSLFKYLAKEPNTSRSIVFKDGIQRPDLQTGDMLRVTYPDGTVKYYFLKLNPYHPSSNALLGSITWSDMPNSFKGEMAISYGWHGDTIPSFDPHTMSYVLILPKDCQQILPLTYSTVDLNANVTVKRAVSLEGTVSERTITFTVVAEDSITRNVYTVLLKKEQDTLDIQQKSTITSKFYKVSEGSSLNETIKGIKTGTTVGGFYANITRAEERSLKITSALSGTVLTETDLITMDDTLTVLSNDKMHQTKYILDVTAEGLSSNTLLTSTKYTISVNGLTGKISGFPIKTMLKTILADVTIPEGASLTIVDQNDAYKTLTLLNYDTVYVSTTASSAVYFEVVAENGINKVLYQLLPDSRSSDAYITSDLYSVDQVESTIYFFRPGTSVASLLRDVTPARGAIIEVMDKGGFIRSKGTIYKDDRLVVISEDKTNKKVYYFKNLDYIRQPYLAFIVSDEYQIDQVSHVISSAPIGVSRTDFISKLFPAKGATIQVLDHDGNVSTQETLSVGDYVLVTSENGTQKTKYIIDYLFDGVDTLDDTHSILIFPNPTEGSILINGLTYGDRVSIISPMGKVIQDKAAERNRLAISLETQPAGIYLFVIFKDGKNKEIRKVMKR